MSMPRRDAVTDSLQQLTDGEVHVWIVKLDQPATACAALAKLLSRDERERAGRFVFDRDRSRFVVCRGALRLVLAAYLDAAPADLTFSYGGKGKPALGGHTFGRLEFNVSHSADVAVIACAGTGNLGVDVECLERRVDFESLARWCFTAEETEELFGLPPEVHPEAFVNGWTRKEAYVKAIGDGLACPLDSFCVTLSPARAPAMRWIKGDDPARWHLHSFRPTRGCVGAVATSWAPVAVVLRNWEDLDDLRHFLVAVDR